MEKRENQERPVSIIKGLFRDTSFIEERAKHIAAGEEIEAPGFKWVTKGEKGPGVEPGVLTEQDRKPRESIWSYIWHDLVVGAVIVGIVFLVLFLACYS